MKSLALLLVAAGLASPATAHDDSSARGCSAVEVTAPGLRRQPRNARFSTKTILDLQFQTRLDRPLYGDHVLRFKVLTPSGFLYQELRAPFSWPKPGKNERTPQAVAVPAASHASGLEVQQLGTIERGGRRRDTLKVQLPVAGTSITMSTLYGLWTVQAFLDDKARPCSPARSFTIHGQ